MDILIQNGTVVNHSGRRQADVLISGGRIKAVEEHIDAAGAKVIDAAGCFVFPGMIDTHTHFDLDTGSAVTADDFVTGTKAALLGGTTTILDFATQERDGSLKDALRTWHEKAKGASCNYGFHMAIARWDAETEAELPDMTAAGVTSYKLYMVYDALKVDDGAIYAALRAATKEGALIGVHCENWDVLRRRIGEVQASGITGPEGHPLSRPAAVEAEAVGRLMRIAELAEAPVYVVHLSTREGLIEARRAKERGQKVFLETCPQYLVLTDEAYKAADGEKYVMSPPLRKAEDQSALWEALAGGEIDFIGTDHCSFTMAQKKEFRSDFRKVPNGGAGVQHRLQLLYTYGVEKGHITLEQLTELLSHGAAKHFGIDDRGSIAPDMAADLVVYDPAAESIITDTNTAHNTDNSPFAGLAVKGAARHVILNGEHAVENGKLILSGSGRYVHRGPSGCEN
ncbi:MAG: dihydropyrimidinase [Clostridiales bacterium]|nr:dihydropyrimidinase [Clostridiales bacterium]